MGFSTEFYDTLDRISEIKHRNGSSGSFTTAYTYTYTSSGRLYSVTDHLNGSEKTVFEYDTNGNVISSYKTNSSGTVITGTSAAYDESGRPVAMIDRYTYTYGSSSTGNAMSGYAYLYNDDGMLSSMTVIGTHVTAEIAPTYDGLGRLSSRRVDFSSTLRNNLGYSYVSSGTYTSGRVNTFTSVLT